MKPGCCSLKSFSRQQKFIKLALQNISIEMNQPFSRCLSKIFLPSSCCSRSGEVFGIGVHEDTGVWVKVKLEFQKDNVTLKESYPRVMGISAFPKLRGL